MSSVFSDWTLWAIVVIVSAVVSIAVHAMVSYSSSLGKEPDNSHTYVKQAVQGMVIGLIVMWVVAWWSQGSAVELLGGGGADGVGCQDIYVGSPDF